MKVTIKNTDLLFQKEHNNLWNKKNILIYLNNIETLKLEDEKNIENHFLDFSLLTAEVEEIEIYTPKGVKVIKRDDSIIIGDLIIKIEANSTSLIKESCGVCNYYYMK